MWPTRMGRFELLRDILTRFSDTKRPLPGISDQAALDTLAQQMIASLRRLDFTDIIKKRDIDVSRADPFNAKFDPEKAAILHARKGDLDEAVWLIFLATHFGKHSKHGWKRMQDVYSGLGKKIWTWERVSQNVLGFRTWIEENRGYIGGAFGNHRKYESLNGNASNGTGEAVASYVRWIGQSHSHSKKFSELVKIGGNNPESIFDAFYMDMQVVRFGRLGKFDFLAMLGRLDFAPITPGKAYLLGATGPLNGARLLFGGDAGKPISSIKLESWLQELDVGLKVGQQVLEDSLCNWQKSPKRFIDFKG